MQINNSVAQGINILRAPQYHQVRSLLGFISRVLSSPSAIQIAVYDRLRRQLLPAARIHSFELEEQDEDEPYAGIREIPIVSAQHALDIVSSAGASALGGLNWGSVRVISSVKSAEADEIAKEKLKLKTLDELKSMMKTADLPLPLSWVRKPFLVDTIQDSTQVQVYNEKDISDLTNHEEKKKMKKRKRKDILEDSSSLNIIAGKRERKSVDCASLISPNDRLRIKWKDDARGEVEVVSVINDSLVIKHPWSLESLTDVPVFVQDEWTRKGKYIDLLVAHDKRRTGREGTSSSSGGGGGMHDLGFATLYSLMAGQSVECSICLSPAVRPTCKYID